MNRTLLLMRHAKSSWDHPGLRDSERPLNKRGKRDAPMMGARLGASGYRCDLIISSPAVRALETAKAVAAAMGYEGEIRTDERLYMADDADFFRVLREVKAGVMHLMLFSHNPGIEMFAERVTGESFEKFPTSAYALIAAGDSWSHFKGGELLRFDFPKSAQVE